MQEQAQRAAAMSSGKQLGLAVLMYTQDYDEVLPTPEGIEDKIEPYLKNRELFSGFVYIFPGGSLADIKNPVETELGYVNGPKGRAIIYVDGHVKWRPD